MSAEQLALLPDDRATTGARNAADRRSRECIGLPLRQIHGQWSSGGHVFDDWMFCTFCRLRWDDHQAAPTTCPELNSEKRAAMLAERGNKLVMQRAQAEQLKAIARKRRMSLMDISRHTGLSKHAVQRIAKGKCLMALEQAELIATALGVTAERLLNPDVRK